MLPAATGARLDGAQMEGGIWRIAPPGAAGGGAWRLPYLSDTLTFHKDTAMTYHRNTLLALALAAASAAAFAQNSTTTTPDSTVGVTNSEAKEALKEAVPRSDTATVTRTGESAADKAREAGNATADALTPDASRNAGSGTSSSTTGSGSTSGTMGSGSTGSGMDSGSQGARPARADRG